MNRPKPASKSDVPEIDLNKWLPQLLDHLMAAWNQQLSKELEQIGLSFAQWRILLITTQLGAKNIRQLSDATLVPHSTLTRWVRHMEDNGLVRSKPQHNDRRASEISVTSKGRRLFAEAYPIAHRVYHDALAGFRPEEHQTLASLLLRLRKNIG